MISDLDMVMVQRSTFGITLLTNHLGLALPRVVPGVRAALESNGLNNNGRFKGIDVSNTLLEHEGCGPYRNFSVILLPVVSSLSPM
jgi:hypothetical protein